MYAAIKHYLKGEQNSGLNYIEVPDLDQFWWLYVVGMHRCFQQWPTSWILSISSFSKMRDIASHNSIIVAVANTNVKLGRDLILEMEGAGLQNLRITGLFSTHETTKSRGMEAAHTLAAHLLTSTATWFCK
eukprot:10460416-Ditylum_brightwellii.AAC.1